VDRLPFGGGAGQSPSSAWKAISIVNYTVGYKMYGQWEVGWVEARTGSRSLRSSGRNQSSSSIVSVN